jgi:predicted CXXCH cytochrome family protein
VLHPVIEDDGCYACHDPHGSDEETLLVASREGLCVECHDDPADNGTLHPIIEDDGCYACHSPHASANGSLLIEPRSTLCLECHDDPTSKAVPHEAAADGGCVDCHDPHSSKNKPLLLKAGSDLCAECHDDLMEGKLHSIIDEDGCLACHDPHSSDNRFWQVRLKGCARSAMTAWSTGVSWSTRRSPTAAAPIATLPTHRKTVLFSSAINPPCAGNATR